MKKYILLAVSIFLTISITVLMFAMFAAFPPCAVNLTLICLFTGLGYMGAYLSFLGYLEHKRGSK